MNLSVWISDWQGVWNQSWIKDWSQIGILLPVHVSGTGWKVVWRQSAQLILRGSAWEPDRYWLPDCLAPVQTVPSRPVYKLLMKSPLQNHTVVRPC